MDYKYNKSYVGPLTQPTSLKKSFAEQQKLDEEREKRKLIKGKERKPVLKFSYERKKMGGIRMCQRCLRSKVSSSSSLMNSLSA
jgi:hypothetical protein